MKKNLLDLTHISTNFPQGRSLFFKLKQIKNEVGWSTTKPTAPLSQINSHFVNAFYKTVTFLIQLEFGPKQEGDQATNTIAGTCFHMNVKQAPVDAE